MSVVSPEMVKQVSDFKEPNVLDIFAHEAIYDVNGFPYVSFSPNDYHPDGPQMELGYFNSEDITGRKEHAGVVNVVERRNAQEHFGESMQLLRSIRSAFLSVERNDQGPLSNSDALKLAHMGIELPRYLIWRRHQPYNNGELPPEAILLNRALRGFHGLMSARSWGSPASQEHRQAFLKAPFSAQETIDFILEKNALENELVCAGHWQMIISMVKIIEGSEEQAKISTADVGFVTSELLDFSKSLRSFWDVVYPNLEHGIKLLKKIEKEEQPNSQQECEVARAFTSAHTIANMANLLICSIAGLPEPADLSLEQIVSSLDTYSEHGRQRDEELKQKIAEFKEA